MTKKEVMLYENFINNRYKYLRLLIGGLSDAIRNKNIILCKILNDEIKKDIEIIELMTNMKKD